MRLRTEIEGLSCASCVRRVEDALVHIPGVTQARANLAAKSIDVEFNAPATRDVIFRKLEASGYPAVATHSDDEQNKGDTLRDVLFAFALVFPVFVVEMGGHLFPAFHHWIHQTIGAQTSRVLQFVLIGLALAFPGRVFFAKGIPSMVRRAPDMNALVALGAGAAFAYSTVVTFAPALLPEGTRHVYFEAAGVIVALILLGRWIEERAKNRASHAIRTLAKLQPDTATVVVDGTEVERATSELRAGDTILVRPGERIAADGIVLEGRSQVNEAMISGEPIPVLKSKSDPVVGATINGSGALTVEVTHTGTETVLSGIVRLVEDAQATKLPIESLIDRITSWFVPAVLLAALLTLIVWLTFEPSLAIVAAVSVLIIACPCAMGLAVPVSIMAGSGRAAELGVLFRRGDAMQRLSQIGFAALDKTGTLTEGKPVLTHVELATGKSEENVLKLASAVEAKSEHPLAQAITEASPPTVEATDVIASDGLGITGQVEGKLVQIGNRRFLTELQIDPSIFDQVAAERAALGDTCLFMAVDRECMALICASDEIKPDANSAINVLTQSGVKTLMITGDAETNALVVAEKLGIDTVHAAASPARKLELIRETAETAPVAFIGDGINDAPALAAADVGIALGTGTDVAMETADVVLMSGNPMGVATAERVSRAVMRNIKQNLGWAFGYNVLLIPVAAGVLYPFFGILLSPMLAAGAMAFSSIAVILNALRLRGFQA